jgi:cytochrome c5
MHNTKQRATRARDIFSALCALTARCALTASALSALSALSATSLPSARATPRDVSARDTFMLVFPKPEEDDLDAARELYKERCERCHGRSMSGDGPLSAGLEPRPQNLRRHDWFERVSSAERLRLLKRVVLGGGLSVGLSALMPPNPDLRNKPKLVYALVYLIASHHIPQPQQRDEVKERGGRPERGDEPQGGPAPQAPKAAQGSERVGRGAPPRSL